MTPVRLVVAGVTLGGLVMGAASMWRQSRWPVVKGTASSSSETADDGVGTNRSIPAASNRRAQAALRTEGTASAGTERNTTLSVPGRPPPPPPAYPSDDGGTDAAAAAATLAALERDQQLQAIRASGPDSSGLARATFSLGRVWERFASAGGTAVNVGPWECHRAGCFVEVVHKSSDALEEVTAKILGSDEMNGWSGTKTRTAPVKLPDGTLQVTWILAATPDGGSAAWTQ